MDETTQRFLKKYEERAEPQLFLASLFQTPPENFHDADKVGGDIVRTEPRIAIPLPEGNTDTRKVELTKFQNIEFEPPVYDTEVSIHAYNATNRRPGFDPFNPDAPMLKGMVDEGLRAINYIDGMTRRAGELQAAKIFTTGGLSLTDANNAVIYTAAFGHKSSHFTTPTAWAADGATGAPETDIETAAELIRRDGKQQPDQLIFGTGAIMRFMANAKIRDNMNKLHMNYGDLERPQSRGGATFHGNVALGTANYEVWSYGATYIDPNAGTHTPYLAANKVIVRAKAGRLDATFGSITRVVPPEGRVLQFLPGRLSNPARGFDVSTFAWVTPNGKSLQLSVGSRMLLIPTAVDTFSCLTVY